MAGVAPGRIIKIPLLSPSLRQSHGGITHPFAPSAYEYVSTASARHHGSRARAARTAGLLSRVLCFSGGLRTVQASLPDPTYEYPHNARTRQVPADRAPRLART